MTNITERIKAVLASVFETDASEINEYSSIDSIENWDSLRHLNMILALEEEFEVSIPDEEVGDLVNFKLVELTINELL